MEQQKDIRHAVPEFSHVNIRKSSVVIILQSGRLSRGLKMPVKQIHDCQRSVAIGPKDIILAVSLRIQRSDFFCILSFDPFLCICHSVVFFYAYLVEQIYSKRIMIEPADQLRSPLGKPVRIQHVIIMVF